MRILVTAGATCEDIDPVRYITNRSSGRMGYAVAAAAAEAGHEVVLVSGPTALPCPPGVRRIDVRSADDMLAACLAEFPACEAVVLVAAVADYKPAEFSPAKIKKSDADLTLRLTRTPDVAARLAEIKGDRVIVGFALETDAGRSNAEKKLKAKGFDAIVLNSPATFAADEIAADLLVRGRPWETLGNMTKPQFAERISQLVQQLVTPRPEGS